MLFESLESRTLLTAGDLDTSFSFNGILTSNISEDDNVADIAIQLDGKIVVVGTLAGQEDDVFVARFKADGSRDTTFDPADDDNGIGREVIDLFDEDDQATSVAIQDNGKILIAGVTEREEVINQVTVTVFRGFVIRLQSNGTMDSTFNGGQPVISEFGTDSSRLDDIAIQPNGKIVVVGTGNILAPGNPYITVSRYRKNGELDSKFANGAGQTTFTTLLDIGGAVAITEDRKILVGGSGDVAGDAGNNAILLRLNSDGSLDEDFDADGLAVQAAAGERRVTHIVQRASGEIAAIGEGDPNAFLWITDPDGGERKVHTYATNITPRGIAVRPDDSLVVLLFDDALQTYVLTSFDSQDNQGFIYSNTPGVFAANSIAEPTGLALQGDGKLVVAGIATDNTTIEENVGLARHLGYDDFFGIAKGRAFVDRNADFKFNGDDRPQKGVRIFEDGDDDQTWDIGEEASVLTDANGKYVFPGLEGSFVVLHDIVPKNYRPVLAINPFLFPEFETGRPVGEFDEDGVQTGILFPNTRRAAIAGVVFDDFDRNGELDRNFESTNSDDDIILFIDRDNDKKLDKKEKRVRNSLGGWVFENLKAGTYIIRIIPEEGTELTTKRKFTVTVEEGQRKTRVFFGIVPPPA